MTVAKRHNADASTHLMSCADHDYDLVHELKHRLDSMWNYNQHIANAKGHDKILAYWDDVKKQDEDNIKRLKSLISDEIKQGCF